MKKIIFSVLFLLTGTFLKAQECPEIVPILIQESCPNELYVDLWIPEFMGYTEVEVQVVEQNSNYNEFFIFFADGSDTHRFGPFLPTGVDLFISANFYSPTDPCFSEFGFSFYGCPGVDTDGDGVDADTDCNDNDPTVYPGATEICDGKDNDCDRQIDEGLKTLFYADQDEDGFPHPSLRASLCNPQYPYTISIDDVTVSDCDDMDNTVYPEAPELCDEKDNNCDSAIDEGCPTCTDNDSDGICDTDDNCPLIANLDQADGDGDGVGDACDICPALENPNQEPDADCDGIPTGIDCDDSDETVTTSNENDADCDGVPTGIDCDDTDDTVTTTNENDADCDGVPSDIDCNDNDATITSTNVNDADCDGVPTSEDCNDNDPSVGSSANDADCDGFLDSDDCADDNAEIYPGATEVCGNGIDDNCDGQIDENCGCPDDADCDGYLTADDCDDTNPAVNPGSTEKCNNSIDDNCDGQVDENCETCIDGDEDGICDDVDNCPTLFNPEQNLDADCDGIPTNLDCNDRDAEIKAQLDLDTDGDGVADCNDREIDSPCAQVDLKGVSIDSDNDGTPNCLDACPNDRTTATIPCSCTDTKDTDGDGVVDCYDLEVRSPCTGTDPINEIDENGVSLDDDHDGVPNCLDICPLGDDKIDTDKDKIPDACDLSNDVRGEPICHVGRNGNSRTIYVSPQQKVRHLAHGDEPGACTSTVAQVSSADAETLSEEQVVLYPNPSTEELNVQVNTSLSSGSLSIYDLGGNTFMQIPVQTKGVYTFELDGRFIPGLYFVKISDGNRNVIKQFIVK